MNLTDLGARLLPIEVKSSATLGSPLWKSLDWWLGLPKNPNDRGLLVYGGDDRYVRGDSLALPWHLG